MTDCVHCDEDIAQDPDSGEWLHVETDEAICGSWETIAQPKS